MSSGSMRTANRSVIPVTVSCEYETVPRYVTRAGCANGAARVPPGVGVDDAEGAATVAGSRTWSGADVVPRSNAAANCDGAAAGHESITACRRLRGTPSFGSSSLR